MRLLSPGRLTLRHCLLLWLIGGGVFAKSLYDRLGDPDLWFHIKTGEYILLHHAVPHHGIFSYTAAGRPWIAHEWLAALVFYGIFRAGGCLGILLWRSLLLTLIFGLLYRVCWLRSRSFYPSLFVTTLAVFGTMEFWGERVYLWMYLFFLTFLHLLWACRQECRNSPQPHPFRFLWPLPLLMLLWVNSHGAYPLGFFLLAAYGIGDWMERDSSDLTPRHPFQRTLASIAIPMLLVIPLNPNGFHIVGFVFRLVSTPAITDWISEWRYPDFHDLILFIPFAILIGGLFLSALCRKVGWPELLICGAMLHLALSAVRHIPLLYLAGCPVIACALSGIGEKAGSYSLLRRFGLASHETRPDSLPMNWTATILLAVFIFLVSPKGNGFHQCVRDDAYPVAAADYIEKSRIAPPILNIDGWGGYLMWRFGEKLPVFHDTRAELYGDDLGMEYIRAISLLPGWQTVFHRYPIRTVLWKPGKPLSEALDLSPDWRKIFADDLSVIYARRLSPVGRGGEP